MNMDQEDPRLTSYLLGELSTEDAANIKAAIDADPALQNALAELKDAHDSLQATIDPATGKLTTYQRSKIIQIARQADLSGKSISTPISTTRWVPWVIPAAAAAAVLLGIMVINQFPKTPKSVTAKLPNKPTVTSLPKGPATGNPENTKIKPAKNLSLTPVTDHGLGLASANVAERPSIELPILSSKPNLDLITQSIRIEHRLPAQDSVHLEQILNSFTYRLSGIASIARSAKTSWHPDAREAGMTSHTATLTTESIACPWKPSAILIFVSIRGNAANDSEAKIIFRPNATTVSHYRLLGTIDESRALSAPISDRLLAGTSTTMVIEVEPSVSKGDFGILEWSVNEEPAANIFLTRNPAAEPSNDARFAALVCAYSKWLAGNDRALIDSNLLSAFAREVNAVDLPPDRADFIKLIHESLSL